jgi:hypothetical protein
MNSMKTLCASFHGWQADCERLRAICSGLAFVLWNRLLDIGHRFSAQIIGEIADERLICQSA